MAAVAVAMNLGTGADIWDQPEPEPVAAPAVTVVEKVATAPDPAPVKVEGACVTIPILDNPGYDVNDGGVVTWSEGYYEAPYGTWVFSDEWYGTIHASVVGTYLWYMFDATDEDLANADSVANSVPITNSGPIVVCR